MRPKQATPRLNRELSWLAFNHRVLQEAKDPSVPLFDRLGFLAIFSSNLDEFFRVRVASLRAQARRGPEEGGHAAALLRRIHRLAVRHQNEFGRVLREEVLPALRREGIRVVDERGVSPAQRAWLAGFFREQVAPKLEPAFLDAPEPPFLRDRAVYLVVELFPAGAGGGAEPRYGLVQLPGGAERFVTLPPADDGAACVAFVDDVVRLYLAEIFPGHRPGAAHAVKLSRDAELYVRKDAERPIAEEVRHSLGRRETGLPCRFLYDPATPPEMLRRLQARLGLADEDLVVGGRYHNLHDLHHFPRFDRADLAAEPLPPLPHPVLTAAPSVLAAVAERDHVLHFPYQAYDPVLRFLAEAAGDPEVEEMWITLYRVASPSAVVQSLVEAAGRGKRVTAVVEVQARFDEAANLEWAERMRDAGVRVIHGVPGLKVHAKLALAARREGGALRDYALLATGNFNERTARVYADHALLTADPRLTAEVRAVFRHLAGEEAELPPLRHLLVAPRQLRPALLRLIDREIEHARAGRPARIVVKVNSLEDAEMIDALCRAGTAGVRVDLVVRGICCLVPGIPGASENVHARSVVDRFLEHARVFVFHDGGADHCWLASADWMTRNLSHRVEVAFPLLDAEVRREVFALLDLQLADNRKARVLDPGLTNEYVPRADPPVRAQAESYRLLQQAAATPTRRIRIMAEETPLPVAAASGHPAGEERKMSKKDREKQLEKEREREKEREKEKAKQADRGMETMFRTSYRMHVDLSALADSKANIMISINGLMISIILAAISPKIGTNAWLLLPTAVVLVSGLISLGFAVLAARPRVRTTPPATEAGGPPQPNLMFFGSFVSLSLEEYEEGVAELMTEPDRLYRDMSRDIYVLGTVLERKFNLLRTAYTVFLAGLVTGVLLYLAVYASIALEPQPTFLP
ncbi:MAG TPA: polyphosphate kinase 1, partial [Longimicrobiaceae bacterium]|nr:polyphosphate kinase 1 [Longimicrobiaceae bacterium]